MQALQCDQVFWCLEVYLLVTIQYSNATAKHCWCVHATRTPKKPWSYL